MRATFSRYAEQLGQLPLANRVNPLGYSYAYFYFVDANNNLRLDDAERGSLQFAYAVGIDIDNPSSLVSPNVNDPDLGPTITDEVTLGYERTFGANFAGGVTLTSAISTTSPRAGSWSRRDRAGPPGHPRRLGARPGPTPAMAARFPTGRRSRRSRCSTCATA